MSAIRRMSAAAAVLGAGVGAFSVASALSSSESLTDGPIRVLEVAVDPVVFAPTSGEETLLFDYIVSEPRNLPQVKVVSNSSDMVCLDVTFEETSARDICSDRATIRTGLAYAAFGRSDGSFLVVGVVPDDVDTVYVGESKVSFEGNVWVTEVPSGEVVQLRVGNSRTQTWAILSP